MACVVFVAFFVMVSMYLRAMCRGVESLLSSRPSVRLTMGSDLRGWQRGLSWWSFAEKRRVGWQLEASTFARRSWRKTVAPLPGQ